jgi:YHS domain-containing protein
MRSTSFAVEESGRLKTYYFCTDEHMTDFARKKGLPLRKD